MSGPLMPKSTAVWLVENTSLTFQQISSFVTYIFWKYKELPMEKLQ